MIDWILLEVFNYLTLILRYDYIQVLKLTRWGLTTSTRTDTVAAEQDLVDAEIVGIGLRSILIDVAVGCAGRAMRIVRTGW